MRRLRKLIPHPKLGIIAKLGKPGTSKRRMGTPTVATSRRKGNYTLVDTRKSKKRR